MFSFLSIFQTICLAICDQFYMLLERYPNWVWSVLLEDLYIKVTEYNYEAKLERNSTLVFPSVNSQKALPKGR